MDRKDRLAILVGDLGDHPAFLAWRELSPGSAPPVRIDDFRSRRKVGGRKALAYRLYSNDDGGERVIAKWCRREAAKIEQTVYERVLPSIGVRSLRFHGSTPDPRSPDHVWCFLGDAGDDRWSLLDERHRLLAAAWLGRVHGAASSLDLHDLPERGPAHYLECIDRAVPNVVRMHDRTDVPDLAREILADLLRQLATVRGRWSDIVEISRSAPSTLVHNDFAPKNLRLRAAADGTAELAVFDWAEGGIGSIAKDVVGFGLDERTGTEYLQAARSNGLELTYASLARLESCGRLLWTTMAAYWDSRSVDSDYRAKIGRRMRSHRRTLAQLLEVLFGERAAPTGEARPWPAQHASCTDASALPRNS